MYVRGLSTQDVSALFADTFGGSRLIKSTVSIAFDQHAATTIAAVVLPGQRTPALHSLTSDSSTIVRFVRRVARANGTVRCCYPVRRRCLPMKG